jgi:hypothetical protein
VPDYIKNHSIVTVVNPNEITVQLDTLANSLTELQKEFIKEMEKLKSSKKKSLKQIQKFHIEINKRLDDLERHTTKELELRFQSLTDKIEDALKELQASASNIQSAHDSLKSAGGNTAQMFVSIKTANQVASLAQEKVNTTKSQVSSTDISFTPHQKLQAILTEIQALGDISLSETLPLKPNPAYSLQQVTKTQTSQKSFDSQSKSSTQVSLQQETKDPTRQQSYERQSKPTLLKTRGNKRYTVTVESDKETCNIVSGCTLPDGTIILSDYSNSKLKRLNSASYTVTDYCDVPNRPWQVCVITDQEVAVCCDISQLIQFVSIGRTLQKTRQISTESFCSGLAYADGKLFVSAGNTSLYVYSMSGQILQQFSMD